MFTIRNRSLAVQCETALERVVRDLPDVIIVRNTYETSITAIFLSDPEVTSKWTRTTMKLSLLFSGRLLRVIGIFHLNTYLVHTIGV